MAENEKMSPDRPPDEQKIMQDAASTLKETRHQLGRVHDIISHEVRRLDKILNAN